MVGDEIPAQCTLGMSLCRNVGTSREGHSCSHQLWGRWDGAGGQDVVRGLLRCYSPWGKGATHPFEVLLAKKTSPPRDAWPFLHLTSMA